MAFSPRSATKMDQGLMPVNTSLSHSGDQITLNGSNVPSTVKTILAKYPSQNDLQKVKSLKDHLLSLPYTDIGSYGSEVQQDVAKISEQILDHTKGKDFDVIGGKLTEVILKVKGIKPDSKSSIPLIGGLIDKFQNGKERIQGNFSTASAQIDRIVSEVDVTSTNIRQRLNILNDLYKANESQYYALQMHIDAAKMGIEEYQTQTAQFELTIHPGSDAFDVQQLADAKQKINNMQIMLSNLERIAMSAVQTAPQIRLMQQNGIQLVDQFKIVTNQVVPGWKRQFAIAIMVDEQQQGAALATTLTDLTNDIARDTATKLRQTSVDIAKANQRGVIDLATLEHVQQELINGIDQVIQINKEGDAQRQVVSQRIGEMQQQLMTKLK